jgi:hypothetical protein
MPSRVHNKEVLEGVLLGCKRDRASVGQETLEPERFVVTGEHDLLRRVS